MKTIGTHIPAILIITCLLATSQPTVAQRIQYKYHVAQQLCQQLATAFGEQRLPKLTMITNPASHRIAQFVSKPEPELFLDEKLYDLCRRFGADSLAALSIVMGHELAHYYGKHADWFGFAQLMKHQQPTLAQAEKTRMLEAQADMQGGYRAFLAGYDTYRLVKPLYTAIYAAYDLPAQMTGYPDQEERIRMMEEQAQQAHTLGMAFETGLFFFLKRDYLIAQRCFEFVSGEMPTKEVLTNIGLCQLLRATQAMTLREMPFRYPFEIEPGNRLRPEDNRGDESNKTDLLKRAISYFRQAIEVDETYTTAYMNQAAALSMLGRTGTAKETIDQLEEILLQTHETLPANARMIRGIALVEAGQIKEGMGELERSTGAYELAYNQSIAQAYTRLNEQTAQAASQMLAQIVKRHMVLLSGLQRTPETHCGTIRIPFAKALSWPERLAIPEPGLVRIQSTHTAEGSLYRIVLADTKYDVVCSRTGSNAQSMLAIQSGDSIQLLIKQYGQPERIVSASERLVYYCYDSAHFFVAIRNGTVKNWFIYASH